MSTDEVNSVFVFDLDSQLQHTEAEPHFAKLCIICFSSSHILVYVHCYSLNGTPKISFRVTCSISFPASVKSYE